MYLLKSSYDLCAVGSDNEQKHVSANGKRFSPRSWNFTIKELLLGGKQLNAVQKQQRSVMEGLSKTKNAFDGINITYCICQTFFKFLPQ